ncbi:MAG: YSIRK-type signal peptide-containing protein [Anaerolineae bacterium]|nr:YSIRK-type signal peptide-containing protein [Anaerolineae bacterium]
MFGPHPKKQKHSLKKFSVGVVAAGFQSTK